MWRRYLLHGGDSGCKGSGEDAGEAMHSVDEASLVVRNILVSYLEVGQLSSCHLPNCDDLAVLHLSNFLHA
jgi:hypothetical protein